MTKITFFVAAPLLLLAACATTSRVEESFGVRGFAPSDSGTMAPAPAPAPASSAPVAPALTAPGELAADAAATEVPQAPGPMRWRPGGMLTTGYFGAVLFEADRTGGNRPGVSADDDDLEVPTFGGGAMWKLGGEHIDMGLEALLSFGWRADAAAFAVGGGGAAVAVDVDLFVFDLYGGPFVNFFLGNNVRTYVSAGPIMQWAQYEEASVFDDGNSSGFGFGYYARTGIEFVLGGGTMIGMGVRWSDTEVDLDNGLGDLDLAGLQIALTFSQMY